MNEKIIKKVLKAKIAKWTSSIKDEEVRLLVEKNTIVTGGSIVSMLLNEPVKDYDVYFRNKETAMAVANYYCDQFNELNPDRKNKLDIPVKAYVLDADNKEQVEAETRECTTAGNTAGHLLGLEPGRIKVVIRSDGVASESSGIMDDPFSDFYEAVEQADDIPEDLLTKEDESEKPAYRPIFLSSNAITLSNKIQLVIRFYGNPDQIHENYDFVHCTNYWTSDNNELVLRPDALKAILAKELRYVGSKYPLCSIIRTRKFLKRGWHINAGQYLKMCFQVSQLDLSDINVLEDQLVGVDSAYFGMLIEALRKKQGEDGVINISTDYVSTLVDRIF